MTLPMMPSESTGGRSWWTAPHSWLIKTLGRINSAVPIGKAAIICQKRAGCLPTVEKWMMGPKLRPEQERLSWPEAMENLASLKMHSQISLSPRP